jgi:hypothetical protein
MRFALPQPSPLLLVLILVNDFAIRRSILRMAIPAAKRCQQPVQLEKHPFVKHPATPPQVSLRHEEVVVFAATFIAFFVLCFAALCFGAGCCATCALEDGAGAASAAQAGTTIKANNNSNKFFMIIPLVVKK